MCYYAKKTDNVLPQKNDIYAITALSQKKDRKDVLSQKKDRYHMLSQKIDR